MVGKRSCAPREDAATLPESERGTKHFRLIWPEFKKRGWTSKPPPSRGIETRWKYILRGGNANGTIGIDYVLGEQAVVDHATNIVRQQAVDRVRAANAAKATPEERPSSTERQLSAGKAPEKKKSSFKSPARRSKSPARRSKSPASKQLDNSTARKSSFQSPMRMSFQSSVHDGPQDLTTSASPASASQHIAECSNVYMHEQLDNRVDTYFEKKTSRERERERRAKAAGKTVTPTKKSKTRRDVRQHFFSIKPILPHELWVYIGLLVARTVMPNREKMANHWHQDDIGAISRGIIGKYLTRDRFLEITRNLHFNNNQDPRAKTDRAWKIRSVVTMLQQTFVESYISPAELSFDEAMLPSRSSYNRTRMFIKDKPHKWGTKLFMLCCVHSAYCIRSGCERAIFGEKPTGKSMRLVVVDRFYTSIVLAVQLLIMGFYTIGTIMTNRRGFCKVVVAKMKKRPKDIPRGAVTFARSKHVNNMTAICWLDRKPVHVLSVIKDYHRFMGGVDMHDQLRLQRYSVQRAITYRKYYKSLFLGLVDLAITNWFIVHRAYCKSKKIKGMTHVRYMCALHQQLIALTAEDMYEENAFLPGEDAIAEDENAQEAAPTGHSPKQNNDWRDHSGQRKRAQKNCKVCAMRTAGKRGVTTTYFCDSCDFAGPIYLCVKPKWLEANEMMSC
ncbi:hypothetical protein F441_15200 [Phytophthora nicotianae CJ01A1]|uniref:PiggyBac transposable element-derived protein domain-containing protein n=1 Tax=Phytophthora nicotianae CJ01A1 TaxID=1317063 RepID=W2WH53_PHYNI|nr:hypothetical protein F441_15200 [Phytophthora nicotianae CJ01A1]